MTEAVQDSKIDFQTLNRKRVGVVLGNQFGVMENYLKDEKLRLLKTMNHMVGALTAMKYQLNGPLTAPSTASSSGVVAIGESYRLIKHGYADHVISGGFDFNLNRHFFEGMELFKANCNTHNDDP